jgi:hypothetical protein
VGYYYDKEEGIILREKRLYFEACGDIRLLLEITHLWYMTNFSTGIFAETMALEGYIVPNTYNLFKVSAAS